MTAELLNLRQARKRRARAEAAAKAGANRIAFGTSKAEKERGGAVRRRDQERLDGHRRVPVAPDEP